MYKIKNEKPTGQPPKFMSAYVAERIKEKINDLPFKDYFGSDASLVPVPKSSLMKENSLWVPQKIANSLANLKLGSCYPCLERIQKVPKSAFSKSTERPKAIDHYNSIKVKSLLPMPQKIILVDDVITRGATLLGCASKLRDVFPNVPIKGFVVLRTISNPDEYKLPEEPCIGKIILLKDKSTYRTP